MLSRGNVGSRSVRGSVRDGVLALAWAGARGLFNSSCRFRKTFIRASIPSTVLTGQVPTEQAVHRSPTVAVLEECCRRECFLWRIVISPSRAGRLQSRHRAVENELSTRKLQDCATAVRGNSGSENIRGAEFLQNTLVCTSRWRNTGPTRVLNSSGSWAQDMKLNEAYSKCDSIGGADSAARVPVERGLPDCFASRLAPLVVGATFCPRFLFAWSRLVRSLMAVAPWVTLLHAASPLFRDVPCCILQVACRVLLARRAYIV
jgi:hypothetical protein